MVQFVFSNYYSSDLLKIGIKWWISYWICLQILFSFNAIQSFIFHILSHNNKSENDEDFYVKHFVTLPSTKETNDNWVPFKLKNGKWIKQLNTKRWREQRRRRLSLLYTHKIIFLFRIIFNFYTKNFCNRKKNN